ncbi:AarF/ABC1/UbiB kinase family protein [Rubellimicrobium sp. CFH 75288]|uniref:ABC1 kinase family protein n=1 Tax=Rubellimicrobium sp. CFH 75288 TaxID=2697034 RepID=UPI0014130301|nr:AarF/ABC1/UbiB kinase family protein [Rubellimicrobium sp. CFH 75288]NAZ35658.1 AarF/ABC1/UbiB kinase family protein [Rubellimicrobium sp. CFH 75288]
MPPDSAPRPSVPLPPAATVTASGPARAAPAAGPRAVQAAAPVPSGRLSRLSRVGGLAAALAGGAAAEGARRLLRGERPRLDDLLLAPANARRLAARLAEMRGAAMKIGQILSMDAGDLLPPGAGEALAALRAEARPMPSAQLRAALCAEWGADWHRRVAFFDAVPAAAASIGQVHRARAHDGRALALKIQYPGIAASIDADLDNAAALLRLSGLLPPDLDPAPFLAEARRQLHEEADYAAELRHLRHFRALLADDPAFRLPEPVPELSTPRLLAMTWEEGAPLETLAAEPAPVRDRAAAALIRLAWRELFEWGLVQTDPHLGNYRWDGARGQIVLLDFGAVRPVPPALAALYRALLDAALARDRPRAAAALEGFGALDARTPPALRAEALALFDRTAEALFHRGPFDFARDPLLAELRDRGLALGRDRSAWRAPPPESIWVQRKLGGLYLLLGRIGARADLRALLA